MAPSASQSGLLIVLCGPSGVGKSTIANRLKERQKVSYTVSATTREHRPGDEVGKKYEHISTADFFRRLEQDAFLEYAHVHGAYYGTPKHPALDELEEGRDVLLEIDVQGALQVRFQYANALLIFILPPDAPTLLQRLRDRARDPEEEIQQRYREAKREIHMAKGAHAFDFFVINDTIDRVVEEIVKIMRHKRSGGI
jgi:guanylate kinase